MTDPLDDIHDEQVRLLASIRAGFDQAKARVAEWEPRPEPHDRAAMLREFVRDHRAALNEPDSIAAREEIRKRFPLRTEGARRLPDEARRALGWLVDEEDDDAAQG